MLIDGYVIKLDYSDIKAMTAELQKIGTNINQLAHWANGKGYVTQAQVHDAARFAREAWELVRESI